MEMSSIAAPLEADASSCCTRLHAIPLVTNDAAGNPIETLQWKAKATDKKETDTPHPIDGADGETLTAELLWVAQSHTGDYHDNVRSNRQHKRGVLEL